MDKNTTTKPKNTSAKPQVPNTEQSKAEHKQNQQYIIVMAIVSGLILIIGGIIIYRLFSSYLRKTNEIKAQDIYINALKQKKEDLLILEKNYNLIKEKQGAGLSIEDKVYHGLPTRPEIKTILGMVENIAIKSGVIANVSTQSSSSSSSNSSSSAPVSSDQEAVGNTTSTYIVSITVEGAYDRVINFLQNCENNLRPLNFRTMTLSNSGDAITAGIQFETYYQGKADIENKTKSLSEYLKEKGGN